MNQEYENEPIEEDDEYQSPEDMEHSETEGSDSDEVMRTEHDQEFEDSHPEEPAPTREIPEKSDFREKLSKAQRERYQALREIEALRHENELLRKSAEISAGQAVKQYDENLSRRLENAKAAKIRAMEEGDVQAQVDADTDLSLISAEVYQTNLIKAQSNLQSSQAQNAPQTSQNYNDNSFYANMWAQENPWFSNPRNQEEVDIANHVIGWCQEFNDNLSRGGHQDWIESPEYLSKVDEYVEALRNHRSQNSNKRELSMRQSRAPISPVRSGYSQSSSNRQSVKLTPDEKDAARSWGIDEKEFLKRKLESEREFAQERLYGR